MAPISYNNSMLDCKDALLGLVNQGKDIKSKLGIEIIVKTV
jgi:hypothetical protein